MSLYTLCLLLLLGGVFLSDVHGLQVRVLDANTVKEPGRTRPLWFVRYSLQLPSLGWEFSRLATIV